MRNDNTEYHAVLIEGYCSMADGHDGEEVAEGIQLYGILYSLHNYNL